MRTSTALASTTHLLSLDQPAHRSRDCTMLDRLPPELLLRILDVDNFRSAASSSSCREDRERAHVDALRACTLVCKNTNSVARPELWREVSTNKSYKQYLHLERMCSVPSFASIAQLVRVLEWYPSAPMRLIEPRFDRLLPVLSNLRELRVFGESVFIEPDMLPSACRILACAIRDSCPVGRPRTCRRE